MVWFLYLKGTGTRGRSLIGLGLAGKLIGSALGGEVLDKVGDLGGGVLDKIGDLVGKWVPHRPCTFKTKI